MACANGFDEIVQTIITVGADINKPNKSGNTPLHWAALNGNKAIVELLCSQKNGEKLVVNTSAKNDFGRIPMEEALLVGH